MAEDGEVLIARQLTMLLTDRGRFEHLEAAYCGLRDHLPPTAALDCALADLLPSSEHEAVSAFISEEVESAQSRGGVPPVHHSLIDGLEELFEQRQSSERDERRSRMDVADLASDLAADTQLAAAYRQGREEAGRWLQRFASVIRERASASPTPTGRRLRIDRARNALLMAESDYQARADDEAEDHVAWCVALHDSLPTGAGDSADAPADQSMDDGPDDEFDQFIEFNETAHTRHDAAPPPLSSLDVLRAPLGAEEDFIALIEAANGHDDHLDPTDDRTVEAMEILLEDDVLGSGDALSARVDGRVRNELWTHMLWGHRVGRYLLMTNRRSSPSFDSNVASYVSSELISCVRQSSERQDVAAAITSSDLGAALHYHPVSSTLRRVCGGDKAQARALVTRTENLGFLTALGVEDLTQGATLDVDETGSEAVGASVGATADASAGRRTRRSVGRDG